MITKINEKLLDAKSALNAVGMLKVGVLSRITELTFYLLFGPGTTDGQFTIESAHDPAFTGTWAPLEVIDWKAANRVHHVAITAEHLNVRVRISKAIVGGTGDVLVVGS